MTDRGKRDLNEIMRWDKREVFYVNYTRYWPSMTIIISLIGN
jgi:hypothetical protein